MDVDVDVNGGATHPCIAKPILVTRVHILYDVDAFSYHLHGCGNDGGGNSGIVPCSVS